MTLNCDWFNRFTPHSCEITLGNSLTVPIHGIDKNSVFRLADDVRFFSNVLYIPDLQFNLLSVGTLLVQGAEVFLSQGGLTIREV